MDHTRCSLSLYPQTYMCVFGLVMYSACSLSCVLYVRKSPADVLSPLCLTLVCTEPQPLLGTSHPSVSPPPSPSAYPACPVAPGNASPPFLPPSLPPSLLTPLHCCLGLYHFSTSFLFLSICWDERVSEGLCVRERSLCVMSMHVYVHLRVFVCTCVFVCASVSLYMWLKFCWL